MSRPAVARPIDGEDFAGLMRPLGPFEPAPHMAVAVSGGADSLALALLLADWSAARGGAMTALIVDHGLRPESRREARWTATALKARGLTTRILTWRGAQPQANVQATARAARYGLLGDWCRRHGVLHLAVAHHLDDQAETLLLRLGRGSGLDGLAAMAPVSVQPHYNLLRPLLSVPKACLIATLQARGQDWIEDPSNQDRQHARVRLRQLAPGLAAEGLTPERLAATAGRLGQARGALEQTLAALLARAVTLDPAGFAWLDHRMLRDNSKELALRALSRILSCLGGAAYGPRLSRLEGLYGRLMEPNFGGATLGGCRVTPRGDRILVTREAAKLPRWDVRPGETLLWDGRFEIALAKTSRRRPPAMALGGLGAVGWRRLRASGQAPEKTRIPAPARAALPCLWVAGEPCEVPHLGITAPSGGPVALEKCAFRPKNGLIGTWFTVA
ncbi:MAG: tRNA lysidine(34) synthetase TilS [Pseudomonadota bacterium]